MPGFSWPKDCEPAVTHYAPEEGSRAHRELLVLQAIEKAIRYPDEDMSWVAEALCPQVDPDAFYPEVGSGLTPGAKWVCAACPVREPCLEYGIKYEHKWGIFGGTTPHQRRQIRAQRRKAAA